MGWLSTVLGMFSGFFTNKSGIGAYLIIGVVAIGLISGVYWKYESMQHTISNYETQLVTEKMINIDNQNQIKSLQILNEDNIKKLHETEIKYKSNLELLQKKMIKDIQRVKTITVIKDRIKYVKPKDDGNVAKVLKDTLEQISKLETK